MIWLVLLNNFLHDFSAAAWLFGAVVARAVLKHADEGHAQETLAQILRTVLFLMRLGVLGIILFGILRALAYGAYEWNEAAGPGQVWLLVIKHIVLAGVFVLGWMQYARAARFIRRHHAQA